MHDKNLCMTKYGLESSELYIHTYSSHLQWLKQQFDGGGKLLQKYMKQKVVKHRLTITRSGGTVLHYIPL